MDNINFTTFVSCFQHIDWGFSNKKNLQKHDNLPQENKLMLIIALLGKITEVFQKYAMVISNAQFYQFGFEYVHETWQLGHIWPV